MFEKRKKRTLQELLLEECILTEEQLQAVMSETDENSGRTFEKLLLEKQYITQDQLARAKSYILDIPYYDAAGIEFDPEILKLVPRDVAEKNCCIPLEYDYTNRELNVITDDPFDNNISEALRIVTGVPVKLLLGTRDAILKKIDECY